MQGKTSHKFFDPSENFIMRLYYQKDVLTFMCFFNELFYSALYLVYFTPGPVLLGVSLFKVIACLSFPVALAKAMISLLHAYVASQNLVIIDNLERQKARELNAAKKPE